jgi:hypothetical protein
MTQKQVIKTENETLPAAAFHPSTDDFDGETIPREINAVSSIEHLLRVALSLGGRDNGLELAEKAVEHQKQYEKNNLFDDFTVDRSYKEDSNDPWLRNTLDEHSDKIQAILNEKKEMVDRRIEWYDEKVMEQLRKVFNNAEDVIFEGEFRTVIVTQNSTHSDIVTDVERDEEGHPVLCEKSARDMMGGETDLRVDVDSLDGTDIRDFGYELPIELLVCESESGSMYPFIPWCGTVVCTCAWKHDNPVSTLCKHEVAALIQHAEDDFYPDGINIPARYKRLINQTEYNRFTDNISA